MLAGGKMIALVLALLEATAVAEDAEKLPVNMNVGTFGVVLPEHGLVGQYIYFGPSVYIPLSHRVGLIPSLTFEVAPGSGAWGFALTTTVDYAVSEHVGLDFVPAILQDTTPEGTIPIVAFGPGATYLFKSEVSLSAACQGAYLIGVDAWVINPGVNLSVPF
jgi:hypothetical protein